MSIANDVIQILQDMLRLEDGAFVKSSRVLHHLPSHPDGALIVGTVVDRKSVLVGEEKEEFYVVRTAGGLEFELERGDLERISLLELMTLAEFEPSDPALWKLA